MVTFKKTSVLILTSLSIGFFQQPTYSFIPYVYEPKTEILEKTSINIAKTAAQLIQLGQTKEAIRLMLLAVRLKPSDDRLWTLLAEAQIKDNQLKQATQSLAKAKKINPSKASLWFAEGSIALRENKPNIASKALIYGLKLDPQNPDGYFQLGNANLMRLKFRSALKSFEKAVQIKPDFWEALNNQGIALFEMKKENKAVKKWRKVLTINENAEPMLALGAALYQINSNNKECLTLARKALWLNPNYISSEYQKNQLWGEKLRAAARELLENDNLISAVERAIANSD